MDGLGEIYHRRDALLGKELAEIVAATVVDVERELIECVAVGHGWADHEIVGSEGGAIFEGRRATAADAFVESPELDAENGGLNFIESAVDADTDAMVFALGAMRGDEVYFFGEVGRVCEDCSAVAHATEVFGGEERSAADVAHGASLEAFAEDGLLGTESLRGVLDNGEVVATGDLDDGLHGRHRTEEVDGDYGTSSGSDETLNTLRVDIESFGVDISEYSFETEELTGFGGSYKRKSGGNDLVATLEVESHEGYLKGFGAVGAGAAIGSADIVCEFVLKGADFGTTYIRAAGHDFADGLRESRFKATMKSRKVLHGNVIHFV